MDITRKSKKKKLVKEGGKDEKRGVCYLGRIPPRMDPSTLRQMLSQFGEIQRVYLTPQDPSAQVHNIRAGKFQRQNFSEGWVEFSDKRVAKRVANMLNGEQIAYKKATREQKLALEISAAKRERDFYLSKVDKSRALSCIEERLKKKQKVEEDPGLKQKAEEDPENKPDLPVSQPKREVIRRFRQKTPVADNAAEIRPRLSKDILAGCICYKPRTSSGSPECLPVFEIRVVFPNFVTDLAGTNLYMAGAYLFVFFQL
ncbi:RNA-binding family protein with RRM/RBD/RNP motifs [Prunus dulcis]|uniref:RNA-binding family protein with RRM/RBD/RNP motifs n=1 Tax=Prunus dulcis TaxID=3755 RepID=A0A4Y1R8D7_PRUDU|nr:RNA-binding family protein with RRM/RBD/RNP motifs [Prunus dulcis]